MQIKVEVIEQATLIPGNKTFRKFQIITKLNISLESISINVHIGYSSNRDSSALEQAHSNNKLSN